MLCFGDATLYIWQWQDVAVWVASHSKQSVVFGLCDCPLGVEFLSVFHLVFFVIPL